MHTRTNKRFLQHTEDCNCPEHVRGHSQIVRRKSKRKTRWKCTKSYGGQRYKLAGIYNVKKEAESFKNRIKRRGNLARIEVSTTIKLDIACSWVYVGDTEGRYAVYQRRK